MTTTEAAKLLNINPSSVRELIRTGSLPARAIRASMRMIYDIAPDAVQARLSKPICICGRRSCRVCNAARMRAYRQRKQSHN